MAIDHVMGWPRVLQTAKAAGVVDDSMNEDKKVAAICAALAALGEEALATEAMTEPEDGGDTDSEA